jgi:hypothetical protein
MSESPPRVYVDAWTLRQKFNALLYYQRYVAGELRAQVDDEYVPNPEYGFPPGTRSQRVIYYDGETAVAVVHQYILPDGSIGASGRPDPKWLLDGGTIFMLESPKRPATPPA